MSSSCCFGCHRAWEERVLGPYLPPGILLELQRQHEVLGDHPTRGSIVIHAAWEDRVLSRYLPSTLISEMNRQHAALLA
jgi:hypothetical protein